MGLPCIGRCLYIHIGLISIYTIHTHTTRLLCTICERYEYDRFFSDLESCLVPFPIKALTNINEKSKLSLGSTRFASSAHIQCHLTHRTQKSSLIFWNNRNIHYRQVTLHTCSTTPKLYSRSTLLLLTSNNQFKSSSYITHSVEIDVCISSRIGIRRQLILHNWKRKQKRSLTHWSTYARFTHSSDYLFILPCATFAFDHDLSKNKQKTHLGAKSAHSTLLRTFSFDVAIIWL